MIRVFITATNENIDLVLERLCFSPKEDLETHMRTDSHITVTTTNEDEEFTWLDLVNLGCTYTTSNSPPDGTPPFHIDVKDDDCVVASHHGLVWDGKLKTGAPLDGHDQPLVACFLRKRALAYDAGGWARAHAYLLAVEDGGFANALHGVADAEET